MDLYSTIIMYNLYVNLQKMCIYRVQEKVTPIPKSVYKTLCAKYSHDYTLCRSCGATALTIYGKASLPLNKNGSKVH